MKKLTNEQVIQASLELSVPDYPEVERTEESVEEYKQMIEDFYFGSLTRGQRRKQMIKENKFSNRIRKQLNKE